MTDKDFAWLLGEEPAPPGMPPEAEGGIAPPEVHALIRGIAADLCARTGSDAAWLMVVEGEAVGMISFTRLIDRDRPEIGYGVAPLRRGRGHAAAAVRALLPIARAAGFAGLVAETAIENPASQSALGRNGFVRTGQRIDEEDGPVYTWAIDFG